MARNHNDRRVGYHYTSERLWRAIQREGLIPYTIHGGDTLDMMHPGSPLKGVWMWAQDMVGKSHIAAVLYQAVTKQDLVIVKLQVEYENAELLHYNGKRVEMPHTGILSACQYHECDLAVISMVPIRVERITKIGQFDLMELIR